LSGSGIYIGKIVVIVKMKVDWYIIIIIDDPYWR